jgi:UDP-N-acetylglucosamine 4-epimerase
MPKWFAAMLAGDTVFINGDGETSRDFCYIDNCVQANILAAVADHPDAGNQVYNVAFGERTTLNELFVMIRDRVQALRNDLHVDDVVYRDFRPGDVRHSLADIGKAGELLGYGPKYSVRDGLDEAAAWYVEWLSQQGDKPVGAAS